METKFAMHCDRAEYLGEASGTSITEEAEKQKAGDLEGSVLI